jgi:MerR family transcriptional regulator, light-induced transcriptional regulator
MRPISAAGSEQAAQDDPGEACDTGHPSEGAGDAEPTLPVAAVARRLGIAPATLRTWDRRYGVGPSGHTTGRHRRYAAADIARLELMQRALLRGAAPAEAAEYALRATGNGESVVIEGAGHNGNGGFGPELESAISATVAEVEMAGPVPRPEFDQLGHGSARAGGRVLRLPGGSPRARGLGRAALAMDALGVQRLIADSIAELGVVAVWDEMIKPVLGAVAARWAQTGECVEVEHLVHECTLAAVIGATPLVTAPRNPRPVLLACVPGEGHSLALYPLRAALAVHSLATQLLGAALPSSALAAAVRRTAPAAVGLWAQLPRTADPGVFDRVPRTRQHVRLLAIGPGWAGTELPATVERAEGLSAAVDLLETAAVVGH